MTIVTIRQYVATQGFMTEGYKRPNFFPAQKQRLINRQSFHLLVGKKVMQKYAGTMDAKIILACATLCVLCVDASGAEELYGATPKNIKEYLDSLVRAYPDKISGHDDEFLILKNGIKFRISDGRT